MNIAEEETITPATTEQELLPSSWQIDYKIIRKRNDIGWKMILKAFLPDFVQFCFPELYLLIDWSRPFESLDTELHATTKNARNGSRIADKLFKVYLLDGEEQWILFHIEAQGQKDDEFPERMLITNYRLHDNHRRPILSCAVLTDSNKKWRPDRHEVSFHGSSLSVKYHVIKLIDYREQIEELEKSTNPFAQVILVQLAALTAKRKSPEVKYQIKSALTRRLLDKGFNKEQIFNFYSFIDWLIALPEQFEVKYMNEVYQLERKEEMNYITTAEYLGIKKGIQQGLEQGRELGLEIGRELGRELGLEQGRLEGEQLGWQQGEAAILIRLLTRKFKQIPEKYQHKIKQADAETLLVWGEKILDAQTLEEVFT